MRRPLSLPLERCLGLVSGYRLHLMALLATFSLGCALQVLCQHVTVEEVSGLIHGRHLSLVWFCDGHCLGQLCLLLQDSLLRLLQRGKVSAFCLPRFHARLHRCLGIVPCSVHVAHFIRLTLLLEFRCLPPSRVCDPELHLSQRCFCCLRQVPSAPRAERT